MVGESVTQCDGKVRECEETLHVSDSKLRSIWLKGEILLAQAAVYCRNKLGCFAKTRICITDFRNNVKIKNNEESISEINYHRLL